LRGKPPREVRPRGQRGARTAGAPVLSRPFTRPAPTPEGTAQLDEALGRAWQVREANFAPEITFARPVNTLPVSLTGQECGLGCAHCNGYYLRHMASLDDALAQVGPDPGAGGGTPATPGATPTSYLISGGCVSGSGHVPFTAHLPKLRRLRAHGRLNFHVGLVDEGQAASLAGLADCVSFDVVGDNDTIREILHLERTVDDYSRSLEALARHVPVVPHILIGLHRGRLRGEEAAVELVAQAGCPALVFIVLIPTRGTELADCRPPEPAEVAMLLARARQRLPNARLGLGCMRPAGRYRAVLDPLAVRAGLQSIVMPARAAVEEAQTAGLLIAHTTECCVL